MSWIGILMLVLYMLLLLWLQLGIRRFQQRSIGKRPPQTRFSIVIPFRNEAEHLEALVRSLQQLSYPSHLYEVILINDGSTDTSEVILQQIISNQNNKELRFTLLQNERFSNSPKKDALTKGIRHATFEYIITTDADCTVPEQWLQHFNNQLLQDTSVMLCGSVHYRYQQTFAKAFQYWDGISLQSVSAGSFGMQNPFLCNGANLCFQKKAFNEVGGYQGNDHLASGDDIFLLEKMAQQFPKRVNYVMHTDASVETYPEPTWQALVQQRIRWASKTAAQKSWLSKGIGFLVFLLNFYLLFGWLFSNIEIFFLLWGVKAVIDSIFLSMNEVRFGKGNTSKVLLVLSILMYPFITVWVVFSSFSGRYSWKGRSHKKRPVTR
ncbi:glycosyltransferase family 2 protein [Luteirhabdus pelagi]|uniref:glycosyltransferase family 2 protein n=1 Tax=Luteirhabdus pelagi TaxID=2792783 RepID=UPI001939E09F|nr:glycosyltransferase [Luteirhabdus pelagi]